MLSFLSFVIFLVVSRVRLRWGGILSPTCLPMGSHACPLCDLDKFPPTLRVQSYLHDVLLSLCRHRIVLWESLALAWECGKCVVNLDSNSSRVREAGIRMRASLHAPDPRRTGVSLCWPRVARGVGKGVGRWYRGVSRQGGQWADRTWEGVGPAWVT